MLTQTQFTMQPEVWGVVVLVVMVTAGALVLLAWKRPALVLPLVKAFERILRQILKKRTAKGE